MKRAVVFHEKAIPTKTKSNEKEISCIINALPKHQWELPTGGHKAHRSFIDKINEVIDNAEEDASSHREDLDDYDRGYDEGYLAGLNYAKELYTKED